MSFFTLRLPVGLVLFILLAHADSLISIVLINATRQ